MSDETTRTRPPAGGDGPADDVAAALAEMRTRLDEAATDIERLTAELEERTRALDDLEGLADVLLGVTSGAVLVVRPDRRVRALSRAAAEMLGIDASHVGKSLAGVVPAEVVAATRDQLLRLSEGVGEEPAAGEEVVAGAWAVQVTGLPDGGAVLVLREK